MDPRTVLVASSVWGITSAVGVAVLGAASLRGGRSRPPGALAFGLFALAWGGQITAANAATLVLDPPIAGHLHLLSLAFLLPLPYLLVEFAASQVDEDAVPGLWTILRIAFAGAALATVAAMVLAPDLVYQGIQDMGWYILPLWGPLRLLLGFVPFFLALAITLGALGWAERTAPTPRTRKRAGILLAGLGLYVGFNASNNLVFYAGDILEGVASVDLLVLAGLFLVLAVGTIVLGALQIADARRATSPDERRRHRLLAAALLVPLAGGAGEAVLAMNLLPGLHTVGLWRLAGVAVLAYGFARWRVFDLPRRAQRAAADGAGTATALASGALGYAAGTLLLAGPVTSLLLGGLVTAGALPPSLRWSRGLLAGDEHGRPLGEVGYGERIDSYRAAVEASMARGALEDDAGFLAALRDRYSITEREDRIVRHYARGAVVVPRREEGPDARYDRLRLLGEGGGGRAWLARDRRRDRFVVVKEPLRRWHDDEELRRRVLEEARHAAKVRHPHVVRVEEVVEDDDHPILVLEYVEGGSLADHLDTVGRMPPREAADVLLDVLAGLEAVHEAGLVHRDLKPANVLLDADGQAKITDFGIAHHHVGDGTLQKDDAAVAGTRGYMAPEVARGEPPGPEADVYGAAALLHVCLTGRAPRPDEPPLDGEDVPDALVPVLTRGLAPDPADRTPSARALRGVLRDAVSQVSA